MKTRVIEEGQRPVNAAETDNVAPSQPQRWGSERVLWLVFGGIALLVAVGLLAGGGVALWALSQRDHSGYFTTNRHRLSTTSYAFASKGLDIGPDAPGWIGDFAGVRIQATSKRPVFLGIGPTSDVARYLAQVPHSQINDFDTDPVRFTSDAVGGPATPAPPGRQRFWRVRASGSGAQTITWPLEKGNWSAVAMNTDGSRGVSIGLRVGARIPALQRVTIGLLTGGGIALVVGASLVYLGARRRDRQRERTGDMTQEPA
jgi:hypothetical protein